MTRIKLRKQKKKQTSLDTRKSFDMKVYIMKLNTPITEAIRSEYYENIKKLSETDEMDNSYGFDRNYKLTVDEFEQVRSLLWERELTGQKLMNFQKTKFSSEAARTAATDSLCESGNALHKKMFDPKMMQLLYSAVYQKNGYFYNEKADKSEWQAVMELWEEHKLMNFESESEGKVENLSESLDEGSEDEESDPNAEIEWNNRLTFELEKIQLDVKYKLEKEYDSESTSAYSDLKEYYIGRTKHETLPMETVNEIRSFIKLRKLWFLEGLKLQKREYSSAAEKFADFAALNCEGTDLMPKDFEPALLQYFYTQHCAGMDDKTARDLLTENKKESKKRLESMRMEERENEEKRKLMEKQSTSAGHDYKSCSEAQKPEFNSSGFTFFENMQLRSSGLENLTNAIVRALTAYEKYTSICPYHEGTGSTLGSRPCSCDFVLMLLNDILTKCNLYGI